MNEITEMLAIALDVMLIVLLLLLATLTVVVKDLFNSIVLLICYGLVMAVTWVRLQAPDIALAEAALGAGVTGALLLSAMARLQIDPITDTTSLQPAAVRSMRIGKSLQIVLVCLLLSVIAAALSVALLAFPTQAGPLVGLVNTRLNDSGVGNPVTAVLINFRAYDTFLEMGVLFLALLGSWTLQPLGYRARDGASPFLQSLLMLSLPLLVLSACYLLWAGADHPGGAFQAGAVLAGAGVLLLLAGTPAQVDLQRWYWRAGVTMGLLIFIGMAAGLIAAGGQLLQFTMAPLQIFLIELAAMFSIAVTLSGLMGFGRSTQDIHRC